MNPKYKTLEDSLGLIYQEVQIPHPEEFTIHPTHRTYKILQKDTETQQIIYIY